MKSHYLLLNQSSDVLYEGSDLEKLRTTKSKLKECYVIDVWRDAGNVKISDVHFQRKDTNSSWVYHEESISIPVKSLLAKLLIGELSL